MWYWTMKKFLKINENVIMVDGANNSAIYDFNTKFVYSINTESANLIKSLNIKKFDLTQKEDNYIEKLVEMGLLNRELNVTEEYFSNNEISDLNFVWLELTERCNEKCVHCYGEFGRNIKSQDLHLSDWKSILLKLKNSGCKKIQFIGGEPLLFKNFSLLLDYAINLNFDEISIFTNATLLTNTLIKKIKENNISIKVSLYGHNGEIHDNITKISGSFNKTISNLELLYNEGVKTSIAVIIMKENEVYLNEIMDFIKAKKFRFNGYDVIRGKIGTEQFKHIPNKEVIKKKCITEPNFIADKKFFTTSLYKNTCWYGKFTITPSGDIIPCIFARDNVMGNILTTDLNNFLVSDILKKYWYLPKDEIDVCKDCEYRYACKDCRPLGEAIDGNFLGKFSRCTYNPYKGVWEKKERIYVNNKMCN